MRRRKRKLKLTWREAWPIWLTFAILTALGMLGIRLLIPTAQIATKALAHGQDATIAIGELRPNLPVLFAYRMALAQEADFFIERDGYGRITAAFASCRCCYQTGHYVQGGHILCGRCRESMVRLASGQPPSAEKDCVHISIPVERFGDQVIVRVKAVDQAFARWFTPPATSTRAVISGSGNDDRLLDAHAAMVLSKCG